jgi:hypothetical protein
VTTEKDRVGSQQLAGDENENKRLTQSLATCVDQPASSAGLVLPVIPQREHGPEEESTRDHGRLELAGSVEQEKR